MDIIKASPYTHLSWTEHQLKSNRHDHNIVFDQTITGKLDIERLSVSLFNLVQDHLLLNSHLLEEGNVLYWQRNKKIHALKVFDDINSQKTFVEQSFNLEKGPLYRFGIFKVSDDQYDFIMVLHPILIDASSVNKFLSLVSRYYNTEKRTLLSLKLQAKAISAANQRLQDQVTYIKANQANEFWRAALTNCPPKNELPYFKSNDMGVGEHRFIINKNSIALSILQPYKINLFTFLSTLFGFIMSRYCSSNNVSIAYPFSIEDATDFIYGCQINTLVLPISINTGMTLHTLIDAANQHIKDCKVDKTYHYSALPTSDIIANSHISALNLAIAQTDLQDTLLCFDGCNVAVNKRYNINIAGAELVLAYAEVDDHIAFRIQYDRSLFDKAYIQQIGDEFCNLLDWATEDDHLDHPLSTIGLLTKAEYQKIVYDWNNTKKNYPKDKTIYQLFEEQVKKTPNNAAVIFENQQLTYQELNQRSNQLARHIRAQYKATTKIDLKPDTLIALCLDRSLEMIVGMLGIMKAGGAYVPIDPEYPKERISFILGDAKNQLVLTQTSLVETLSNLIDIQVIALDTDCYQGQKQTNLPAQSKTTDLAYVIYTSGTTGTPKGVLIENSAFVNFLLSMRKKLSISTDDVLLAITTVSFDISGLELFLPLITGASVVIATQKNVLNKTSLERHIRDYKITVMQATPTAWQALLQSGWRHDGSIKVLCGGEALPTQEAKLLLSSGYPFWNLYGPTETTIWSSAYYVKHVNDNYPSVPIGFPIANTCFYILDKNFKLVPTGVPGELYIGGVGLTRGYLNRDDLTQERFIDNPFVTVEDKKKGYTRLYKTGDLVRWLSDGNLEYIERNDFQVKIRGYRIELGEIEHALTGIDGVKQACVLTKEKDNNKYLVGYYIIETDSDITKKSISEKLSQKLPDYMIPSVFVKLEHFPLKVNGKLDREALPELESVLIQPKVQDHTTQKILDICYGLLGYPIHDMSSSLLSQGFNSLLLIRLSNELFEVFNVSVDVTHLLGNCTIDFILERLTCSSNDQSSKYSSPFEPELAMTKKNNIPLSYQQLPLWFISQVAKQNLAYNAQFTVSFVGDLDIRALEYALTSMVERHEIWRTTFHVINGEEGTPIQKIHKPWEVRLDIIDLACIDRSETIHFFENKLAAMVNVCFDLTVLPLIKWVLFKLSDTEYSLVQIEHHFLHDGWSIAIFSRELKVLYEAYISGVKPVLDPLPLQYKDFVLWQRRTLTSAKIAMGVSALEKKSSAVSQILNLPIDFRRPAVNKFRGQRLDVELPETLYLRLKQYGMQQETTVFTIMFAVFGFLMKIYSGQSNMFIGTSTANRPFKQLEYLMGMLVNTFVVNVKVNGQKSFQSLLKQTQYALRDARTWQNIPLYEVVKRMCPDCSLASNPLFQVMFGFHDSDLAELHWDGLEGAIMLRHNQSSKMDLNVICIPKTQEFTGSIGKARHKKTKFLMTWEYNIELFRQSTIEGMIANYIRLLELSLESSKEALNDIYQQMIYKNDTYQQVIYDWNNTDKNYPQDKTIYQLFEEQVNKTPSSTAIIFENQRLTYKELNQRSNQLARHIRVQYKATTKTELKADTLIALCLNRSLEMIIGILGVIKAGGAYVPIDPEYPSEHIKFILDDTQTQLLLTQSRWVKQLQNISDIQFIPLDTNCYQGQKQTNLSAQSKTTDLAYVIYTSGTTGRPKGVMIEHKSICNTINFLESVYILSPKDNVTEFTSYVFDVSVSEIFITITQGACLHVLSADVRKNPDSISQYLNTHHITYTYLPPALLEVFPKIQYNSLKAIIYAGEPCHAEIAQYWSRQVFLFNIYGPTEATIYCLYKQIKDNEVEQIGKPIDNISAYVLDVNNQPVPIGVIGELYIGGVGLARGYLNRNNLTQERFIDNPFVTTKDKKKGYTRLYKTGDLVRWLSDGNLEYIGRNDLQVKIRGYRIELGEIESILMGIEGVKQACVLAKEKKCNKYLVGYYVAETDSEITEERVLNELSADLPDYMLPSVLVRLESFPLMVSGKLDRKALPDPTFTDEASYVAPSTDLERTLCHIWQEILDLKNIGRHDNFFRLGGNSLMSINILHNINKQFTTQISLLQFFNNPTIAQLAHLFDLQEEQSAIHLVDINILKNDSQLSTYDIPKGKVTPASKAMNNILLTGTTGFVGAHLLIELLNTTDANIYCLIRGKNDADITRKFRTALTTYKLKHSQVEARVILIRGDLSEPSLGIDTQQLSRLSYTIDAIYHSGCYVHHIFPYEILKPTNVLGTIELIRLARTHKAKPIYFISTVGAAIKLDAEGKLAEDFPDAEQIQSSMGYYQTKWVSEKLLAELSQWGHPVSIYRLGRITGQSKTGICNFAKDHFQLLTKGCIQMGYAPDLQKNIDMLPVNIVTQLITQLSLKSNNRSHVFNILNDHVIKWGNYIDWLKRQGYSIELLSYGDWVKKLKQIDANNALYTLSSFYVNPLNKKIIENSGGPTANNSKAKTFMKKLHIEFPFISEHLLKVYLTYLLKSNFLPKPALRAEKMSAKEKIINTEGKYDSNFNDKHDVVLVKGQNAKVWDLDGNEYIDCISGMGVMSVGHANPSIINAIQQQVEKLSVCHHAFPNDKRAKYLEALVSILPKGLSKIYLCNSGTEAVEAALKVSTTTTKRHKVIACTGGYHGLTLGSTGLASAAHLREPCSAIINEARFIEYNNIPQLEAAVDNETAMLIFELVQGSAGGAVASHEFVDAARKLTSKVGAKLIFDEVLTGFCRTGKWFATDHYDVQPDGILMAKAIGGGLPIGAFAMREELASAFPKGIHSNTFGGNPMSMAAGLAAIEFAKQVNLCEQAEEKGQLFRMECNKIMGKKIHKIKGLGLLIGLELENNSLPYLNKLRDQCHILALQRDKTILFLPPLTLCNGEIKQVISALTTVLAI